MSIGFPKPTGSRKVARGLKRAVRKSTEDATMRKVRTRDRYCRFPLCGCGKFKLALHVAHQKHRGMGGNPAGDRTDTHTMVLVCSARHKENHFALDRHTIEWRALTSSGADGNIAWFIHSGQKWIPLARETAIRTYEPSSLKRTILGDLAEMKR